MTTSITSPLQSGPRPLQLVAEGTSSPVLPGPATAPLQTSFSAYPSPLSTGLPTPPTHPVSTPTDKRRPKSLTNSRRQSSIPYFSSDHQAELRSPSPRLPPSFSPLSPSPTPGAASSTSSFRGGSRRTASLSVRTSDSILTSPAFAKGNNKGNRRSLGFEPGVSLASPGIGPAPDRAPLTLTEKHADLLRFIAQKESKCLELRSQLAVHEAELKELKRKWERIVSRGMDRAYSSSPPSTGTSPNPSSTTPHGLASALLPTGNTGAVLGGIKEGVQDLGRLLAAGLDLSGGAIEETSTAAATSTITTQVGGSLGSVSRASMTPALKKARHVMTQSVSSVSTSTTAVSDSTAGTRLSQSSVSSISFLDEEKVICEEPDEDEARRREISVETTKEQIQTEEIGSADISISPSSVDRSTKLLRRRSRDVPKPSVIFTESQDAARSDISSPVSPSNASAKQRIMMKRASTGLAPSSSIPGLVPLSQPVSSWMGSVGKKWEEIQKGETFTKSQKRASLLLSDVSQSIFAALASPTTPIGSQETHPHHTSLKSPKPSSSISISTNPFLATISPLSPSPSPMSNSASPSLLDDDFEETTESAFSMNGKGLGEVLVPMSVSTPSKESNSSGDRKSLVDDDDDWNW